jgi:hypothetical protein
MVPGVCRATLTLPAASHGLSKPVRLIERSKFSPLKKYTGHDYHSRRQEKWRRRERGINPVQN